MTAPPVPPLWTAGADQAGQPATTSTGSSAPATEDRADPRPTPLPGEIPSPETGHQPTHALRRNTVPVTHENLDTEVRKAVRHATRTRQAFYVLVLAVALVGQVTGAAQALDIPLAVAIPAVATLELGGVVVMADADVRRRLGERALASRLLSAAIAAGAVTFNWAAHPEHLLGGFYAGMSALGYLVWLIHAGNQRRDRLRATGNLPPAPPAYELVGHWIRHPAVTLRARTIAKADGLDLYESQRRARAALARENRNAAIARVLHRRIRAALDTTTADIAVQVYDLDEIAARLSATADYNGLTTLLAADLAPERIITANNAGRRRRWCRREGYAETPRAAEPTASSPPPPAQSAAADGWRARMSEPTRDQEITCGDQHLPAESHDGVSPLDEPTAANPAAESASGKDNADNGGKSEVPQGTAEAVAYWLRKEPNMDPELLAEKVGRSLRSVYRYLPADYPRRPGIARERTRRHTGPA
ncbi:hypothetical protein AB0D32_12755 [Micromonospora sp. NPDC048170]|uniref:hypothetical protein n=1 Tax=Micromonospora sp. NPDC048170 TaxID=3154819 RepID=UPI0033D3AE47